MPGLTSIPVPLCDEHLHLVQNVLQAALVLGAIALYRWPRRRTPLQMAAFTGALLVGFELILTHWFYLYLPWFFPFVAFALLAWGQVKEPALVAVPSLDGDTDELAAPRAPVGAAFDEHAFDPDVAGRDLEPNGKAGGEAADRPVGNASDHGVVWPGHSGVGDGGSAAG